MKKRKLLEIFFGSRSIEKVGDKLGFEVFSVDWEDYGGKAYRYLD